MLKLEPLLNHHDMSMLVPPILFCNAIFCRIVPSTSSSRCYKGYAVGMNIGHRDIVQNVAKIESTEHVLIDLGANHVLLFHANQQDSNDAVDSSLPIIRSTMSLL
eukprot:15367003-Ditylum_brightwellii.AAC.1